MQAFLWRHLVPAAELKVAGVRPHLQAPAQACRRARVRRAEAEPKPAVASHRPASEKPKFTKQQVAGRLRQLKLLFEEGLLTDDFYDQRLRNAKPHAEITCSS